MNTQYTTLDEAKDIAKKLDDIGGGVLPYIAPEDDPDGNSGIYIPEYSQGPFRTPSDADRKFYHFRFRNGAEGLNAGLIRGTMRFSPARWKDMVTLEVNAAHKPSAD